MEVLYLLICFVCCMSSSMSNIPSETLELLSGSENVLLDCHVEDLEEDARWYFITDTSETLLGDSEDDLFGIEHDSNMRYQLVIKMVTTFVEGRYMCKQKTASRRPAIQFRVVDIKVYYLPDNPMISCDIEKNDLEEGDTVTLTYNVFIGDVPANITIWTIDSGESIYHVENLSNQPQNQFESQTVEIYVTRNMTKIYVAAYHSLLQKSLVCITGQLNVRYPPRFQGMPNALTYKIGYHLDIQIHLTSNPMADIIWDCWKNNKLPETTICKRATLQDQYILRIEELSENDNGTMLQFHAFNTIGIDDHSVTLYSNFENTHTNPHFKNAIIIIPAILVPSVILFIYLGVSKKCVCRRTRGLLLLPAS